MKKTYAPPEVILQSFCPRQHPLCLSFPGHTENIHSSGGYSYVDSDFIND